MSSDVVIIQGVRERLYLESQTGAVVIASKGLVVVAPPGPTPVTGPVGLATQTNTAFARGSARPVGRATEVDTALALSASSSGLANPTLAFHPDYVTGDNPPLIDFTAPDMEVGWFYQLDITTGGGALDGLADQTLEFTFEMAVGIEPVAWGITFNGGDIVTAKLRYGPTTSGPWSNWSNQIQVTIAGVPNVDYVPSATPTADTTGGTTTKTRTAVAFEAGRALITTGVQGGTPSAISVGGIACTQVAAQGSLQIWRSNSDVSAGNHDVVITNSTANNFAVFCGTLKDAHATVLTPGGIAWASQAGSLSSGSLTVPTDGLLFGLGGGDLATAPVTVTSGSEVDSFTGLHAWKLAERNSTGALTWGFSAHNFKGAVWVVFQKA